MIKKLFVALVIACLVMTAEVYAQSCPENIGFEYGNFQNWKLYAGSTNDKGVISTSQIDNPASGRHTIITDKSATDPYGEFKLIPENGGNFAVRLGNSGTGQQVDQISYLIDVPANRPEFALTYQYAVVLEDPNHLHEEQPRFIARVKDIEKNEYIPCASFEYIATSNLPGFQKSKVNNTVIYKNWSPVTINLSGYQGKQLLLEFITSDCTLGGHFGYAYLDVNATCSDLIVGNTYCKRPEEITISGPSGFQDYNWYNADKTIKYGSGQSIVIKPTPPEGTKVILDVTPFAGFGCPSSISTVIHNLNYQIQVSEKNIVCQNTEIDLTTSDFILNKLDGFNYIIYRDKDLTQEVKEKIKITENTTFYIKATNYKGCESIASIDISVFDMAVIRVKNPDPVCYNETVDITSDSIYTNAAGLNRTYFSNAEATQSLANAKRISTSGIYYARLTNNMGCSKIFPIEVTIKSMPVLKINNPTSVCFPGTVDLTSKQIFAGSDETFSYIFYQDQNYTNPLITPQKVDKSGIYYVKATNANGCIVNGSIVVEINDLPVLAIKQPEAVCFPEKVDITKQELYSGSSDHLNLSFFYDEAFTKRINNPKSIAQSGTYYVKANNVSGCEAAGKIQVEINSLPTIIVNNPKAIFDSDFIDITAESIIKGSKNYVKTSYFDDPSLQHPVANPNKINKAGTYYIALQNEKGCTVSAPVTLNILPKPKIIVPTAFTPHKETNNKLYPFLISVEKITSFKVFNKWGILVYQSETMANGGWDGQFRSKMQPMETFSWFAEGIDTLGGKVQSTGKTILIL